jgi:HEAT repeats
MQVLREAGYLIVPNLHVLPTLKGWKQAVLGGLFFTLSIGSFLTLLSLAAFWLRYRLLPKGKPLLPFFAALWLALLFAFNIHGFSFMATLYALAIPPLVFSVASRWLFEKSPDGLSRLTFLHILAPLLLAVLWATQMDGSFFVDVRDYLLLSHSVGTKINDFYYRYTLYPAETFKSMDQKLLKAVYLGRLRNTTFTLALERELLKHDYLPVNEERLADLVVGEKNHELIFQHRGEIILRASLQRFLTSPAGLLADFSRKTDNCRFFRKFTFISLLIGFPLLLYLLLDGLLFLIMIPFVSARRSWMLATLFCLVAGILLFLFFFQCRAQVHDERNLGPILQTGDWRARVAAFKYIESKGLEVSRYQAYRRLLKSPCLPEKYWLARALGASRDPETFGELVSFLDDPRPTVVSIAFYSLGERKNPAAIRMILERIVKSEDWYNQWNAYKALRALGWKQSRSR